MHGRVKVRTSEEQAEAKRREQQEKLKVYTTVSQRIFSKRSNQELDEEALQLTARILEKNSDFYTFWNYRREILTKLKLEKSEEEVAKLCLIELDLTTNCLKSNPKSYSVWNHRVWVMEFYPKADWKTELKLCNHFLSQDERNFHCWDYRRLVCKKCMHVPLEAELDFTTSTIESNFSNYSAWHYRSKLLPVVHKDPMTGSLKEEILLKEFELIQNAAFTDPNDQSVWFYHRWLLGRNKTPLHILNVSIFKSECTIAVLLSEMSKINNDCLKVQLNGLPVVVTWRPVSSGSIASTIWLCNLPEEKNSGDQTGKITVELSEGSQKSSLSCSINGSQSFVWEKKNRADTFRSELSAATREVLEQELESCQQLNELEPNCKWTLFTCVMLMRALNESKFQNSIADFMKKLTEVDPMRRNYYKDLGSKFVIEDAIETLPVDATNVDLSSRNLTCLYHSDQFLLIQTINLSSNDLTSCHALSCLISAKIVNLDDNRLSGLESVDELKSLEVLSVKRNLIQNISHIARLSRCLNLKELYLEDNPVVNEDNYVQILKTLPSLMIRDGITL